MEIIQIRCSRRRRVEIKIRRDVDVGMRGSGAGARWYSTLRARGTCKRVRVRGRERAYDRTRAKGASARERGGTYEVFISWLPPTLSTPSLKRGRARWMRLE